MACGTKSLSYSSVPPTQSVLSGTQWMQYPCLTSVGSPGAPLEFRIDRTNSFVDISQLYLNVSVSVKKQNGEKLGEKDIVSTANLFGYSMFSSAEVFIQDQKVTQDQGLYPWMMYVKMLTGCTKKELEYFSRPALYRKDEAGLFDQLTVGGDASNPGFAERHEFIKKSGTLNMLVKLGFDFTIDRLIPDQTEVLVRLNRSDSSLCLMAKDGKYNVDILSASLLVPRVTLTSAGLKLASSSLNGRGLTYPSTRTAMRSKVISKNDQNCEWVPFHGTLPKRIYVFQISQSAFNGNIKKNIFNFQNFDLKQIQVLRNDESLPLASAMPVEWESPHLLYIMSMLALGDATKVKFNSWEFSEGYALMCFDLTNDNSAESSAYVSQTQSGSLRIKLDYNTPLAEPITVFCMGEFDAVLTIDKNRTIVWNAP